MPENVTARREQQVIMQIQDESREDRRGGVNIVI